MTTPASKTLRAFTIPAGLPVAEFDFVNQRVSECGSGRLCGTPSPPPGMLLRIVCARRKSTQRRSRRPSPNHPRPCHMSDIGRITTCLCSRRRRARQLSACSFAAHCIGALANPSVFPLFEASHQFYPSCVRERFVQGFPSETLTSAMQHCLSSGEYTTIIDIRNVLAHWGTPPRQHFLSTIGPEIPSAIPGNLTELASDWRYDVTLEARWLEPYRSWLEHAVRTLVMEAANFTAAHLVRS